MTGMLLKYLILITFVFSQMSLISALADDCPSLPTDTAKVRMIRLSGEIRHHNTLYYGKNSPEISDAEYDKLFSELSLLEKCFPKLATADSPTLTVGEVGEVSRIKARHDRPMLSLSSSIGPEAVEALLRKVASEGGVTTLLVQPKVDGLPVELVYVDGQLVSAATRGDGRFGEVVTDRVRKIRGIPLILVGSFPARVVVRGEIYADLQAVAASGGDKTGKYATMRHLAAGTLLSGDPDPHSLAVLRFFPFELVNATQYGNISSDREALHTMAEWGFPVQPEQTHPVTTLDGVRDLYRVFLTNRGQLPFAADGIVVKVDDLARRQRIGDGSRAPFWAAAWKFPPATVRTMVREIRWQVGRTGRRTPVAEVVPVSLGGILVRRVSLHNSKEVARLGIKAGAQVVVALVGDVIPQIIEVVERGVPDAVTETVPVESGASGGGSCFRDSPGCRDRFLSRAVYFSSKSGLDMAGLGRGRLKTLIEAGLVHDLPSIFRLPSAEIAVASALGPKTAFKVAAAIRSRRHPPPFRTVAALGISGVGPIASQRLSLQFHTLDALLAADEQRINALPKCSGAARSLRQFFGTPEGKGLLQEFRDLGIW